MSNSSAEAIRILHVDDEPDFAETAGAFLEREVGRFVLESASDADEAEGRLAEADFDCVISDYDMPGRNGIEFLKAVRADYPALPFILFTGKGSEEVASEAISAGVTDYLQKEVGTDQYAILANRISNAVERARAEQARQRHLEAIETAREGMSILDEDGAFIYVNDAYADLYGYDREELLGEHWGLLYPDEDVQEVHDEILPRVEANAHWQGETTGLRADGRTFPEDHTLATTDHGELICLVRDMTARDERKQTIKELHSTARAFIEAETAEAVAEITVEAVRDILEMPGNGVHLYDTTEGGLVPVAWTGRTEELVGEPPTFEPSESLAWQAFEREEAQVYGDISSHPGRHNPATSVQSQILLPLEDHGLLLIGSPERDAFEETDVSLAQIVAAHATTALDRVEREQTLAQQNERLETFTSVVSHDLQNPLSVATGKLALAQTECDSPLLDDVEQALDRTAALLDDLHEFAQVGTATLEPERIELEPLCETCWQHVETDDATLVTETARSVHADRSRLQQLIENLIGNAVEHGSTSPDSGAHQDAVEHGSTNPGSQARQDAVEQTAAGVTLTIGDLPGGFFVADDGPGIPPADRDQIFERGYSTSEESTGFGLAIVRDIVELHDWEISVTESEAGGTRFDITGIHDVDI